MANTSRVESKKSVKPGLKASTVSLSTNAFSRQFYWDMVCKKNEYLYSFVFVVIILNLCPCSHLVLVSTCISISISLFGAFAILYIILYTIVNRMSFRPSYTIFQPSSCIILVTLLYFE